jgi:hypothetical protein
MRTLFKIIEEVKSGGKPDYEELRYALLAYQSMFTMDHNNLLKELTDEKETPPFLKKIKANNSFNMVKAALNKSPKEWLGWNHDPDNPDYQRSRKISEKIFNKFISNIDK